MNIKDVELKIATMGDPKSDGVWKSFVARNQRYEAEQKEKEKLKSLVKFGVENSSTPVSTAPPGSKKQKADVLNYVNKEVDPMYEGDHIQPKLADQKIFENNINRKDPMYPAQASPRQIGDLAERLEQSRQMTGGSSIWDDMKATAKTPAEKKEIRDVIRNDYNRNGPKNMAQDDLRWIGKAKAQTEIIYPKIKIPSVNLNLINRKPEPEIPIDHRIKVMADRRLKNEQRQWDYDNGKNGITDLLRPK